MAQAQVTRKTGTVVSRTDKTLNVEVHVYKAHPKYKKRYRISKKFLVHDPNNEFEVGETVSFHEVKPISKRKCWLAEPKVQQKATEGSAK